MRIIKNVFTSGMLIIIFASFVYAYSSLGCIKSEQSENNLTKKSNNIVEKTSQKMKITLYFADKESKFLVEEKREISKTEAVARASIEELIKGPKSRDLVRTIPEGTKLKNIKIEDSICYPDFSQELISRHWGGSSGERMTVYSIVNTLTNFSSIKSVRILIEGKEVATLKGHMDLSEPILRNEEIIKK